MEPEPPVAAFFCLEPELTQVGPSRINELFKMQKAAIRIIAGAKYNSHTEPLFKKLQILPLPDLIMYNKIQFMQRFTQQFLPESFNDAWVRNIEENKIHLPNAD